MNKMKRKYIKPDTGIVKVNLMWSVLQDYTPGIRPASDTTGGFEAREQQSDRFWDDDDDE